MIHPKLESYIATRDRKIAKYWPHDRTHIRDLFVRLLEERDELAAENERLNKLRDDELEALNGGEE